MKYNRQILFSFLFGSLMTVTALIHYLIPAQSGGAWDALFGIWCLMVCVVGVVCMIYTGRAGKISAKENGSPIDELTGLPNRNYFKEAYGEQSVFNTMRYKTIAVFDIDGFKEANDTLDGDDVLRSVADCARRTIGEQGEVFRWGGDEFMVLMEWSMEFAYEICREFCKEVEKGGRVTVSVGVTEVKLSDTIKKNYYRAVQGCYLVKEMGGNGVKRN